MYALSGKISEGTLRETFFANHVGAVSTLTMPKQGDFMADGKYLFEVGGSRKTFDQIAEKTKADAMKLLEQEMEK